MLTHSLLTFHQWFVWIQHLFHQHSCSAPLGQHQINPPGLSLGFSLFSFPYWSEDWQRCTRRGHEPGSLLPFAGSGRFGQRIDQYKLQIFLRIMTYFKYKSKAVYGEILFDSTRWLLKVLLRFKTTSQEQQAFSSTQMTHIQICHASQYVQQQCSRSCDL